MYSLTTAISLVYSILLFLPIYLVNKTRVEYFFFITFATSCFFSFYGLPIFDEYYLLIFLLNFLFFNKSKIKNRFTEKFLSQKLLILYLVYLLILSFNSLFKFDVNLLRYVITFFLFFVFFTFYKDIFLNVKYNHYNNVIILYVVIFLLLGMFLGIKFDDRYKFQDFFYNGSVIAASFFLVLFYNLSAQIKSQKEFLMIDFIIALSIVFSLFYSSRLGLLIVFLFYFSHISYFKIKNYFNIFFITLSALLIILSVIFINEKLSSQRLKGFSLKNHFLYSAPHSIINSFSNVLKLSNEDINILENKKIQNKIKQKLKEKKRQNVLKPISAKEIFENERFTRTQVNMFFLNKILSNEVDLYEKLFGCGFYCHKFDARYGVRTTTWSALIIDTGFFGIIFFYLIFLIKLFHIISLLKTNINKNIIFNHFILLSLLFILSFMIYILEFFFFYFLLFNIPKENYN